jgi:hypothetical protein
MQREERSRPQCFIGPPGEQANRANGFGTRDELAVHGRHLSRVEKRPDVRNVDGGGARDFAHAVDVREGL